MTSIHTTVQDMLKNEVVAKTMEKMIQDLNAMTTSLSQCVRDVRKEGGALSQCEDQLVAVRGKAEELLVRCGDVLGSLLKKAEELYETTIPEDMRCEVQKHVASLQATAAKVAATATEVLGTVSQQTVDEVTKRASELSAVLERVSKDLKSKASALSEEHVQPRLMDAKAQLSVYSPPSYEMANSAFASLADKELSSVQRVYSFATLLMQALYFLVLTFMGMKKVHEEAAEESFMTG